jgi:hypothetical protein
MPVVINEFEVVERSPLQRAANETPSSPAGEASERLDPLELQPVLRSLEIHAVRAWAH